MGCLTELHTEVPTPSLTTSLKARLFQALSRLNSSVTLCWKALLCTTMVPRKMGVRPPMMLMQGAPVVICAAA